MNLLQTTEVESVGKTISEVSPEKLAFLIQANESNEKVHEIRYDEKNDKYLDITAYKELEDYVGFVMVDVSEQIRQEEIARIERDKYSHLLDTIPGGIAVFDLVKSTSVVFNYFNDEICHITGYTREEILQNGVEHVCEAIPEDLEMVQKEAVKSINAKRPAEITYRTRKKDGELRYLRARITIEETNENKLIAYVSYTDVTAQQQTEKAISAEMKYLSEAQDRSIVAKCRINVSKNIIDYYTGDEQSIITSDNPNYADAVEYLPVFCCL